jgi:hypothetical protein
MGGDVIFKFTFSGPGCGEWSLAFRDQLRVLACKYASSSYGDYLAKLAEEFASDARNTISADASAA